MVPTTIDQPGPETIGALNERRSFVTGKWRYVAATVSVLAAILAGCGRSNVTLAKDWSGYDSFVVVQRSSRLVLFGLGSATGKVAALAYLDVTVRPHVVPSTSVLATPGGDTLLVVGAGAPNGSQVYRLDRERRAIVNLGAMATGDLPITIGAEIGGVGPQPADGDARYTSAMLQRYRVGATGLTERSRVRLAIGPVAASQACYVGQGVTAASVLVRADRPGPDIVVDERSLAQDVACRAGVAIVALNRRLTGPVATAPVPRSTNDHRLVVLPSGAPSWTIDVGDDPAHVAFLDGTTAVVDVGDVQNRALQLIDLATRRISQRVALPSTRSLTALTVTAGHVIAVGENAVTTLDGIGRVLGTARLPGASVTFHYVVS